MGEAPFDWEGGGSDLAVRPARSPAGPMPRLVADARGARGGVTTFLVDSGSSCTTIAGDSALAREARVWPSARVLCRGREGSLGLVPRLGIGTLVGRDVTVQVLATTHSLEEPANVIGQDLLRRLRLRHVGGRWSVVRAHAAPPADVLFEVPLVAPGLPMVRVADGRGRRGYAMIDTGAPEAIAATRESLGRWHLEASPGAMVLDARLSFDAPDPRVGRWPITLMIGLGPLSGADWELDLEGATWRFLRPARGERRSG